MAAAAVGGGARGLVGLDGWVGGRSEMGAHLGAGTDGAQAVPSRGTPSARLALLSHRLLLPSHRPPFSTHTPAGTCPSSPRFGTRWTIPLPATAHTCCPTALGPSRCVVLLGGPAQFLTAHRVFFTCNAACSLVSVAVDRAKAGAASCLCHTPGRSWTGSCRARSPPGQKTLSSPPLSSLTDLVSTSHTAGAQLGAAGQGLQRRPGQAGGGGERHLFGTRGHRWLQAGGRVVGAGWGGVGCGEVGRGVRWGGCASMVAYFIMPGQPSLASQLAAPLPHPHPPIHTHSSSKAVPGADPTGGAAAGGCN